MVSTNPLGGACLPVLQLCCYATIQWQAQDVGRCVACAGYVSCSRMRSQYEFDPCCGRRINSVCEAKGMNTSSHQVCTGTGRGLRDPMTRCPHLKAINGNYQHSYFVLACITWSRTKIRLWSMHAVDLLCKTSYAFHTYRRYSHHNTYTHLQ